MMLCLLVDNDRKAAEKLADKLASLEAPSVRPYILDINEKTTTGDVAGLAIKHIERSGRPAAVLLAIELPGVDPNSLLDFIAEIGEYAPVIPMGRSSTISKIIKAAHARKEGGMPLCVYTFLAIPPTALGIAHMISKIRAGNRQMGHFRQITI